MNSKMITHFELDPEKLAIIHDCMDNYDVGSPEAEWANNLISRKAVVYQSGVIARNNSLVRHLVDPAELALCQELAENIEKIMSGTEVGMGSESSAQFRKFYIVSNADEPISNIINEKLIRSKFGETIFPPATLTIEPLIESGIWWNEVLQDGLSDEENAKTWKSILLWFKRDTGNGEYFKPWKAMMVWFKNCPEFVDTAFVRIGDREALWALDMEKANLPDGTEITGCVLPRLALGLTHNGSLVGLFGYSVQT